MTNQIEGEASSEQSVEIKIHNRNFVHEFVYRLDTKMQR